MPGSSPQFFEKAARSAADVVFLDLEDAVAPDHKVQARKNIVQALHEIDWGDKTLTVRINGLDTLYMYRDVIDVIEQGSERLDMIMIPNGPGQKNNYLEFITFLTELVKAGQVPPARIDDAEIGLVGPLPEPMQQLVQLAEARDLEIDHRHQFRSQK